MACSKGVLTDDYLPLQCIYTTLMHVYASELIEVVLLLQLKLELGFDLCCIGQLRSSGGSRGDPAMRANPTLDPV